MRPKLIFAWYDFWIGFYWDAKRNALYFFPVPMLGLRITIWGRRCYVVRKHGLFYREAAHGYTNRIEEAGRFTLEEAQRHEYPRRSDHPCDDPVTKHHLREFIK